MGSWGAFWCKSNRDLHHFWNYNPLPAAGEFWWKITIWKLDSFILLKYLALAASSLIKSQQDAEWIHVSKLHTEWKIVVMTRSSCKKDCRRPLFILLSLVSMTRLKCFLKFGTKQQSFLQGSHTWQFCILFFSTDYKERASRGDLPLNGK